MKILLSPAKNMDFESETNTTQISKPIFPKETEQLVGELKKMSSNQIGNLMKLSPKLAQLNFERFQEFNNKNTPVKQCAFAFNGEVYSGLNIKDFSTKDLELAQDSIRILSGLYGYLKPLDSIHPYRLEMGTKISINGFKNLYEFWGDKIIDKINSEENENGLIVNLASNEYSKAANLKKAKARIITCEFKEFKNGDYKTIMVYAKKARGLMASWLIKNKIKKANQIIAFDLENYEINSNLSSENNFVFTR